MTPVPSSGRSASGGTLATFIAAFVLLVVAALAWRQGRMTRAALAASTAQYELEVGDLRVASLRLRQADQRRGELRGRTAAAAPADAAAAGAKARGGPPDSADTAARQRSDGQAFLAAFPRARELLRARGQRQFEVMYAPLLRAGAINPAQMQELEDATVGQWLQTLSLSPQGGFHVDSPAPPDASVKAILGEAGFQQWQDYNRTLPAQGVVQQVATGAGLADAPLSGDQADQLAKIVAAASPAYQDGKAIALGGVDWDAALAALRSDGSLSPAQQQAAERVFLTRQYQASLGQAQRASRADR